MNSLLARRRRRDNRIRRNRIGKAARSRTFGFQVETLESRTVLSHGTFFDFDGLDDAVGTVDGGVSNFTGFDWLPGAIYGVNGNQAVTNFLLNQNDGGDRDTTVQGYYHAKLGSFLAEGGDVPVPAGVEYTVVAGLAYEVESVNFIGVDVLATFQFIDSGERFFEFRFDTTPDARELTGLGFNDGQLILSATPTEGNIDFRQENNDDGSPITDILDDNGTDNYPGTTTIIGNGDVGGAKADIGFSDPNFFQLPPGTGFGFGTFASTQELNFNNVDPSWQFTTAGGVMPFLPKPLNVDAAGNPDPGNPADPPLPPGTGIDTVNGFPLITPDGMPTGLGGPDNTLKADGSNSFEFVVAGSIHGFKFEDLDADGAYEPLDGEGPFTAYPVQFELTGDVDGDGVDETVTTTIDTDPNSPTAGEFWFTNLFPGDYTVREVTEDLPEHIMPSPNRPTSVDLVVGEGQELVWADGAAMLDPAVDPQVEVNVGEQLIFGDFIKGSIHAFGFEDMDADGNYEPPTDTPWPDELPGKKIDLLDANGDFITSQTTDATGQVWFLGLTPGVYMLQEDISIWDPNHIMPSPDPDGPGPIPGGADKRTVTILSGQELVWQDGAAENMLLQGQEEELVDDGRLIFGNFIKGSIHAFGFEDMDADGNYEPPTDTPWPDALPGKKIDLLDANGDFITSATTDATGQVWFLGLTPGVYMLQEDISIWDPNHIMPSPDPDGGGPIPGGADKRTVTITSGKELVWQDDAAGMLLDGQEEELVDDGRLIFGNFIKGSIHAFGFEDMDADGNYEPPTDTPWPNELPGKKIDLLDANGDFITSATTDSTGQVWFLGLTPGVYMLQEDISIWDPNHIMPSPDPDGGGPIPGGADKRTVTITSGKELVWQDDAAGMLLDGQEEELVDDGRLIFGNFIKGSIHGFKFEDLNGNGVYEPGTEDPLPGVTFELLDNLGNVIGTEVSDDNGQFWFTVLTPGDYSVREDENTLPDGYELTTPPNERDFTVGSGDELVWQQGAAGTLLPGQQEVVVGIDLIWGNAPVNGSIHGIKFKDVDANGLYDPAIDQRLAGVEFTLTRTDVGGFDPRVEITDANGEFWFADDPNTPDVDEGVPAGIYTLTETVPDGFMASTPTVLEGIEVFPNLEWVAMPGQAMLPPGSNKMEEVLDANDDGIPDLLFGNFEKGSIHGVKFKDLDADGLYEPNDPDHPEVPWAGFEFVLTDAAGEVVGTEVSNDAGEFWFTELTPGTYTVTETVPDGFMTSTHDMADPSVTLTIVSGQEYVWADGAAMLPDPIVLPSMKFETQTNDLLFGNFEKGSIHGFKFKDLDADGLYEPNDPDHPEVPWAGFEFVLTDAAGEVVGTEVSNDVGEFWFTELTPGTYTVTETVPDGFMTSTHDMADPSVTLTIVSGQEYVWADGAAMLPDPIVLPSMKFETQTNDLLFGNFEKGSIHGFKFKDLDADGVYEPNDPDHPEVPWAGFEFVLTDAAGEVVGTEVSNDVGEFWFTELTPGTYTVTETVPDGFMASTATAVTLTIVSGQEYVWADGAAMLPDPIVLPSMKFETQTNDLLFGNFEKGSIHGFKFKDLDADGLYEPNDPDHPEVPWAGFEFVLTDAAGEVVGTEVSNDVGEFWFTELTPGTYTVTETVPDGFMASTATAVTLTIVSGQEYVWADGAAMLPDPIVLPSMKFETQTNDLLFGNFEKGSIHGFKFKDLDADGLYEPNDPDHPEVPWAGFEFVLTDAAGEVVGTEVSNDVGEFWFTELTPGTYTVTETVPDGFMASTATAVTLTIVSGQEYVWADGAAMLPDPIVLPSMKFETQTNDLLFGNFEKGSIHGFKFKDLDADGLYEPNDPDHPEVPWAGFEFVLTDASGAVVGTEVSNDAGEFWFTELTPGTYTVTETVPDGFMTSTHDMANPSVTLTIVSGQEYVWADGAAMLPDPIVLPSMKFETQTNDLLFGNFEKGSIHGFKFKDLDADGLYEPNDPDHPEVPWAGFEFVLTDAAGAVVGTEVSNDAGEFWFTELTPGTYTVTETVPDGFMASTATSVTLTIISGQEYVWADGAAMLPDPIVLPSMKFETQTNDLSFGNFEKGSIHGFKFKDLDADGLYEPNDPDHPEVPWAGFEFVLTDAAGAVVGTEVSNDAGEFWFTELTPGTYTVTETVPDGFMASTATAVTLTIVSGQEYVWADGAAMLPDPIVLPSMKFETQTNDLLFGNFEKGSIHGFKFKDLDADGLYEPNDPDHPEVPWAGFEFVLTDAAGAVVGTEVSNDAGEFWFTELTPGTYTVTETVPDGFMASTATAVTLTIVSGQEYVWADGAAMLPDPIVLPSMKFETQTNDLLFGNFEKGSIHGFKFKDLDADGLYEPNDPDHPEVPWAGFEFVLTDAAGAVVGTELSNEAGEFWFTELTPGTYTVTEAVPNGFMASTATSVTLTIISGQEYVWADGAAMLPDPIVLPSMKFETQTNDLLFGNFEKGSIHGFKFKDLDADGLYEPNDPDHPEVPWAGFEFVLTDAAGAVVGTEVSNDAGEFWFTELTPGTYTVTETVPDGFMASTATTVTLTIISGQEYVWADGAAMLPDPIVLPSMKFETQTNDLLFGNFEKGSIHGFKFKDLDADGVYEPNDPDHPEVPWAGFEFVLTDAAGAVVGTEVSNDAGEFWFTELTPGTYTVTETVPDGIMASTATAVTLTIVSGQEYVWADGAAHLPDPIVAPSMKFETQTNNLLFGNFEDGSIHALKFFDRDGDGIYEPDASDTRQPGVDFTLTGVDGMGNPVGPIVETSMEDDPATAENEGGLVWFTGLKPGTYTITETVPTGQQSTTHANPPSVTVTVVSGQEYVAMPGLAGLPDPVEPPSMKFETVDDRLVFGNTAIFQGCTPGFWKNNWDKKEGVAWEPTGLSGDDNVLGDIFMGFTADPDKKAGGNTGDDVTLHEALQAKGGGENALMRHATAAYLNSVHPFVFYAFTPEQVVELVNNALASGDPGQINAAKNQLAAANEEGCSIDQQGRPRTAGDIDADGDVDTADVTALIINYTGANVPLPTIDIDETDTPDTSFSRGDFDRDGDVDTADFTNAVIHFTGAPQPAPVAAALDLAFADFGDNDAADEDRRDLTHVEDSVLSDVVNERFAAKRHLRIGVARRS